MKQIKFDLYISKRNVVKISGTSNTKLISALKTLRINNKILGNNDAVKSITKDINKLERYKNNKSTSKRKYYINKEHLKIVSKLHTGYGAVRARKLKSGMVIEVQRIRASNFTRRIKKPNTHFSMGSTGANNGGYYESDGYDQFDSIIKSMGSNFKDAYSRYQDDIERLANSLGIDLDEYLINFEV